MDQVLVLLKIILQLWIWWWQSIFGYGTAGTSNIVNNSGVLQWCTVSGTTGVTYRAAAGYGTDKGIFAYGVISGKT